ncbi:MAG: single-stranded DNA-binding protein [Saprospiraceae bacterium]|nr:single-stranded DNA-binding protein [Saprospiraceae bacterium]MBK8485733.1 single-stranded DNA-binding protein [Saprospiraceae bacterium]MBK9222959.1 single-stranded DNA-binding protein [Saprospiraceae bacterium]MBK9723111.1 single-stranded DNA-binding protein [Saprospiraceae bacterium]MBK9726980.1 single-stranded DNA-binding protein [Saprospiraceae bacterium]
MLNKVTLIGNLGKDPEIRALESGVSRANFTLATNESYKDRNGAWQKSTEWHDIVMWRSMAERAKVLKKGMLVYLEGKLTHRKWTDKEGRDHYSTEITADVLRILEKREYTAGVGSNTNSPSEEKKYESPNIETAELADDDLPF